MSCGVGCSRDSDPELLWLWRRLAATALIRPLAWEWEPPHAMGAALEKAKKRKKKKGSHVIIIKTENLLSPALGLLNFFFQSLGIWGEGHTCGAGPCLSLA